MTRRWRSRRSSAHAAASARGETALRAPGAQARRAWQVRHRYAMAPTVQTEVQGVPARPRLRQPSRNSSNVCGPGGRGTQAVSAPQSGESRDGRKRVMSRALGERQAAPCPRDCRAVRQAASRCHEGCGTRSAACRAPCGRVRTGAGVLQQLGLARAKTGKAARPPREHQAVCHFRHLDTRRRAHLRRAADVISVDTYKS